MKTRIYSLLVALMSVVAFSACDDWTPAEQEHIPPTPAECHAQKWM